MRAALVACALAAALTGCGAAPQDEPTTPDTTAPTPGHEHAASPDHAEVRARALAALASARDIVSDDTRQRVLAAVARLDRVEPWQPEAHQAVAEVDGAVQDVRDEVADWVSQADG